MKAYLTLMVVGLATAAHAFEPVVVESEKKVYYSAAPVLGVSVTEYEPGKAFLSLSYNYDTAKMRKEFEQLTARYKGYEAVGLIPRATDEFEVSIPSLHFSQKAEALPSQYGPYADWSTMLSAPQLQALKGAMKTGRLTEVFNVKAPVEVTLQKSVVIEEVRLPGKVCEALLGKAHDLRSMILNLVEYLPSVRAEHASTLNNLNAKVLDECYRIESPTAPKSMTEALQIKLSANAPKELTARTYGQREQKENFDQAYEVEVKE